MCKCVSVCLCKCKCKCVCAYYYYYYYCYPTGFLLHGSSSILFQVGCDWLLLSAPWCIFLHVSCYLALIGEGSYGCSLLPSSLPPLLLLLPVRKSKERSHLQLGGSSSSSSWSPLCSLHVSGFLCVSQSVQWPLGSHSLLCVYGVYGVYVCSMCVCVVCESLVTLKAFQNHSISLLLMLSSLSEIPFMSQATTQV